MSISFELSAFMLSLFCIIYCLTAKRKQYVPPKGLKNKFLDQHFVFLMLLISNLMSAAASVTGTFLLSVEREKVAYLQYFFHALYFVFHTTLAFSFALYIMNHNGTSVGKKKKFFILFFLPYVVSELLVLTNRFTDFVFYMDADGYHRGPLIVVLYAIGAFYIILGAVFFFRHKQAISRADTVTTGIVIVMASIGILVQGIWSDIVVELFFESLAFLVLMMLLEERGGHIDAVTGAYNRVAFASANQRMIETGQSYKIVLVKLTNADRLLKLFSGRDVDALLMQVSQYLTSISSSRYVYTFRYLDFAVIVPDNGRFNAEDLVQPILKRFESEWDTSSMRIILEVVMTIISIPRDVSSLEKLESILASGYKKTKPGSFFVPVSELTELLRNKDIETSLRNAIYNSQLELFYQPICTATGYKPIAAEALLRVKEGDLQGLSPQVYIPIAEKTGMIKEIGLFVFEEACRFLSENRKKLQGIGYIEINVSIYQLFEDLSAQFDKIREKYGIDVNQINLEITETASTSDTPEVVEAITKLRLRGYHLSIDDFGTGYSNLVRMLKGHYQNIKIDKSLLWDSDKSKSSAKMLEDLTGVLRGLGYNIIQEGVETKEQLQRVAEAGCNLIQGYYFSKPLPEKQFLEYLQNNK